MGLNHEEIVERSKQEVELFGEPNEWVKKQEFPTDKTDNKTEREDKATVAAVEHPGVISKRIKVSKLLEPKRKGHPLIRVEKIVKEVVGTVRKKLGRINSDKIIENSRE